MKKASYEKMLAIFDKLNVGCNLQSLQEWEKELAKLGWTDKEFDMELTNRIMKKAS